MTNNMYCTYYGEERESTFFYHSDHLGSAQLITDCNGDEYQRLEYTPYGETWMDLKAETSLILKLPYKFSAKELDEETGLYYYGARYLDPKMSRWISADPAMNTGEYFSNPDAGMGGIYNHVNFNLYHYAGNNPIRFVDPTGLLDEDGLSDNKSKFKQRIENKSNGFGFITSQQIRDYNNSEAGQFARKAIDELKTTEWSRSVTGKHVMSALEDAYKRGKIFVKKLERFGEQLSWGNSAKIYIDEKIAKSYMSNNEDKIAVITLAHEGSHYSYATRAGVFSGWWFEYEIEGYRINDILSFEFYGKFWLGGTKLKDEDTIVKELKRNKEYNWLPRYPGTFKYWNKENIGK